MNKISAIAALACLATGLQAQETWSLRRCIDHAIEHNIDIRQAANMAEQSAVEVNTAKWARLPNLSGGANQSWNWGRTQTAVPDETTGDYSTVYVNTASNGTNMQLSTSIPLFTGLELPNQYALAKLNLKAATADSLLILDEIGRGTSTFDGMSIARAVLEYCADPKKLGAKTLFATHYHELTALEGELPGVRNYNIAVRTRGEDIIFLRKIISGGADRSYGIEVAKLAGLPKQVLTRARHILQELEDEAGKPHAAPVETDQVSLEALSESAVIEALRRAQVDTLSPLEALNLLYELKSKLS